MYYDLNDIELTSNEVRMLRRIKKNLKIKNSQSLLHLASHELVRYDKEGKLSITGRGNRLLEMENDKLKRNIIWSILVPVFLSVVAAFLTTKLLS